MKLSMADTRRRVKLYTLNNTRQWDDRGTGHVLAAYSERQEGMTLMVRAESDGTLLLESKIQSDTAYQKQQETLIVWSETESSDLALSFQEKAGCDEIWEKICEVQGKDPSVDITQDMPDDGEDDEDDLTSGRLEDGMDGLQHQSTSPYSLPVCELGELDDISECFSFSMRTPVGREQLARSLEENNYIPKLLELFRQCEDLEDTESLHKLFEIVKYIFLLNKSGVFDVLIQEEYIMAVVGCLEYDPALPEPRRHRQYLTSGVSFKEVLPISNVELRKKIHQTFRLQYIQDVVLPTPSVFEENMLSTLASVIFFNKVEIVSMVQEDTGLLPNLFKQLGDENVTDDRRRELAGFLRELCCLSQTLQPGPKDDFFKYLNQLGLLPGIEQLFACEDQQAHRLAIDIFQHVVEHSPSMVRDFANQEMTRDNNANGDEDLFLLNMVIEQMICDPDPELSGAMQLNGLLRILLDPENMLAKNNEKTEFLAFFYLHCIHKLMAPVLANTADESGPSKDDYQTAHILSLILDLVTFSVEHHTYHVKNYILNKDLLRRVMVLLKSKHKFLGLAALRFMRRIVGKLDEFYNRYIIKGDLFKPVVNELFLSGRRYNLINSAILEMFEFINTEKIKSLTGHIIQQHFTKLETIDYVQTFTKLKTSYDQHQDRYRMNSSRTSSITADDSNSSSMSHNHRFGRDTTSMDEEEEMWFDREADDDVADDDSGALLDLDTAGVSSESFPPTSGSTSPKMSIDSVFEASESSSSSPPVTSSTTSSPALAATITGTTTPVCEKRSNGTLQENKKIAINIPSMVKGVNGLNSSSKDEENKDDDKQPPPPQQPTVKNGMIGLVDYSDDDSDDEDSNTNSSSPPPPTITTTTTPPPPVSSTPPSHHVDAKDKIITTATEKGGSGDASTPSSPVATIVASSPPSSSEVTTSSSSPPPPPKDGNNNGDSSTSPPVSKKPRLSIEATASE